MTCRYGAKCHVINGVAECLCHDVCDPMDEQPITVCGTDSKTYGSECQLKLFSCRLQQYIRVAYQGPCQGLFCVCNPWILVFVQMHTICMEDYFLIISLLRNCVEYVLFILLYPRFPVQRARIKKLKKSVVLHIMACIN